jgi:Zn-dependent M28 family amino/carboxypeptidase
MSRSRFAWPLALFAACSAFAQYPGSAPPPAEWKKGFDSIKNSDGKAFLSYLAGPECMGRGTGQPGFQKAADFIAARFKEFGLKPVGDDGTYFQNLTFWRSNFVDAGSEIKFIGSGKSIPAGAAFRMTSISAPIDTTAVVVEVTPAGDELGAEPEDLAKKIVVVKGDKISQRLRASIVRARPAAILYITAATPLPEYTIRRSAPSGDAPQRTPVGSISAQTASEMMANLDMKETGRTGSSISTIRTSSDFVRLVAKVQSGEVKVPNVVGLLEGSDPSLKAEIVGLGSHLDHLGVSGGQVYWGADDDGSGSTALLQIVKAFATNPQKPKRSLLFMTFCGEEMGLVGSGYYADHPIFPHDKMIAELQMDMVGRNSVGAQNGDQNRIDVEAENRDTIRLVGSKRISTDLDRTISEMNRYVNFKFKYDAEDVYTRSDHYNFAKNGIPIAFLFTGFHPDYHQVTDTIEKINFDKISNTAKLFYLTAARLANTPDRPRKDVKQ